MRTKGNLVWCGVSQKKMARWIQEGESYENQSDIDIAV